MKNSYVIIAVLLLSFSACKRAIQEKPDAELVRVRITSVQQEKMSMLVIASGLVVPAHEIKLSFKTGGIIAGVFVSEGSKVRKGDMLATLNLSEIEAQVTQASSGFDKARRDYERAKNLYSDSVVTLEQLQNAETAMNVSKAVLETATFNLQYARITSPENGIILKKLAETNEVIGAGYPVLLFGSSDEGWKIKAGLNDRDFVRISPGDSARVSMDAYPGANFGAVVRRVSEAANPLTGTYEIELDLNHKGYKLATGFVANLEIFPRKKESYLNLPVQALVEADGNTGYVFTVSDSMKAKKVKVNIVRIYQSSVAVAENPDLTDSVVTEGAAYLSDGDPVIVVR